MRIFSRVKVRQDGQHRQEITDQMTSGIAEKSAGARKIVGQKTDQRAARQERDERDKILSSDGGEERKTKRADGSQSGAKAVHVVHEVKSIDDSQDPEHGY